MFVGHHILTPNYTMSFWLEVDAPFTSSEMKQIAKIRLYQVASFTLLSVYPWWSRVRSWNNLEMLHPSKTNRIWNGSRLGH